MPNNAGIRSITSIMAFRQMQSDAGEAKSASDGDAGIDGIAAINGHSSAAPDVADRRGRSRIPAASPVRAEQDYVSMLYALLDQARERSEQALRERPRARRPRRHAPGAAGARRLRRRTRAAPHPARPNRARAVLRPHRRREPGHALHRPHRPARRRLRAQADRLARPRRAPLLRRHAAQPGRPGPPPPHLHQAPHGHRRRRRGVRPRQALRHRQAERCPARRR